MKRVGTGPDSFPGQRAAEYGNRLNLSLEEMDSIIRQGKELGIYLYIYTGGEPLVRKADLLTLCERHSDCVFLSFTNASLIDEQFAKDMLRVKNFVPSINVEGDKESHEARRGNGSYDKICTEDFYDQMIEWGASFVWYFHYMPVGNDAAPELMPTPEQRTYIYEQIRHFRKTKGCRNRRTFH